MADYLTDSDLASIRSDIESLSRSEENIREGQTKIEIGISRVRIRSNGRSDVPVVTDEEFEQLDEAFKILDRIRKRLAARETGLENKYGNLQEIQRLREEAMQDVEYRRQTQNDLQILREVRQSDE